MECNIYSFSKLGSGARKFIEHVVSLTLKSQKMQGVLVSVNLISVKKIQNFNRIYRNVNAPTDVLSFQVLDRGLNCIKKFPIDLGDIFLCEEQIKKNAKTEKIPFKEEFARVLSHGVLHLLGFDHARLKEKKKMFAIQEQIVCRVARK
jgi:probable rRNA maturation factor